MSNAITHSFIFVAVLCLNTLAIASAQSGKSITIHQEIEFNASPQQLYEALLDSKQFTEFSGRPAELNREVGGAFSLFKGHIIGRNLELVPNQRIHYTDTFEDPNLPGEIRVTVTLKGVSVGTQVNIVQEGLPEVLPVEACYLGWQESLRNLARLVEPEITR